MDYSIIHEALKNLYNAEKSKQMSAYQQNLFDFLGIPSPKRRAVQKQYFIKEPKHSVDWDFVAKCWEAPYRELQYVALDYLRKKSLKETDISSLKQLVITKSWWDSVDNLAPIIGKIVIENPHLQSLMQEWSIEENIWLRRVAIIHQLLQKQKVNTELLSEIIKNNFGSKEFFINKAIGWALRDYSKTNPQWVKVFLAENETQMAKLSIREAKKYV